MKHEMPICFNQSPKKAGFTAWVLQGTVKLNSHSMKRIFWPVLLLLISAGLHAQESVGQTTAGKPDLTQIRPNSRDYAITRKGNSHQRVIQMRTQAMVRHQHAMMNRKAAMEKRRAFMQQRMMRQQQVKQRMIYRRNVRR